jgi:hypothetical protein
MWIRFSLYIEVSDKSSHSRIPRKRGVRFEIDTGHHIGRVRSLGKPSNGGAGEPGPLIDQSVQRFYRTHFHLCCAAQINKLNQQKIDLLFL